MIQEDCRSGKPELGDWTLESDASIYKKCKQTIDVDMKAYIIDMLHFAHETIDLYSEESSPWADGPVF